jgi:hypothetical protein
MVKSEFERHVESQLKRLSHLVGFPTAPEGLRDYCAALAVAKTSERVQRVVAAFVGDAEMQRCPTAAQLRGLAYDLLQADGENERRCGVCGGAGAITAWKLVTYHGKSTQIKHVEGVLERDARSLAERLAAAPIGADRQMVLSAAKECECRKRVMA